MSYQRVAALLKARTGIDSESLGSAAIERAVRARLAASGLQDSQRYFDHLCACATELQELIEHIVVPETWFFRDHEAFAALSRIAAGRQLAVQGTQAAHRGILRAVSLPCSTGEEPYSIAMCLLDAGLARDGFQIDAIDISARAVAHAARGIYGRNSFRGTSLQFRDRYFEPVAHGHRLSERVRQQVRFRQGNLFDMGSATAAYDVVFCRNVLIYFDRAEQQRALQILSRLLVSDGVLFVGPSETGLLLDNGFVSARIPRAFAFRKPGAVLEKPQQLQRARGKLPSVVLPPTAAPPKVNSSLRAEAQAQLSAVVPPTLELPSSEHWLAAAQRLADQGEVAAALAHCEQQLANDTPSARAFYLVGLLNDAAGRPGQAIEYYRKALYLDPAHGEALVHLAMLLQADGDARGAQLLLDRAQRSSAAAGK